MATYTEAKDKDLVATIAEWVVLATVAVMALVSTLRLWGIVS